jgi:hypothetical protein
VGSTKNPQRVKLFCGFIYSDETAKKKSFERLEEKFGKIDLISSVMPFDFSTYYESEMGVGLQRFWGSFEKLISEENLAEIKVFTNSIENDIADNGKRKINIDPGYITPANVILATTKNYSHRIYISKGIYAEVTVIYRKTGFVKLPWSYPDYLSEIATQFFLKARADILRQLKNKE